jgi:hypothetical protein
MTTLLPSRSGRALCPGDEVVSRMSRCDWDRVRSELARADFERVDRLVEIWRTSRRLGGRHDVELEVSRVGAELAEIRVVPRVARWPRWGPGRQRRYVELAHAAADGLVDQVMAWTIAVRTSSLIAAVPPYTKPIVIADLSPVR